MTAPTERDRQEAREILSALGIEPNDSDDCTFDSSVGVLAQAFARIREEERKRAEVLQRALDSIANDPHCIYPPNFSPYEIGVTDGHRCASTKAQAAIASDTQSGGDRG